MSRLAIFGIGLVVAGNAACTETPVSVPLRSLERSGQVSFVCATPEGEGRDINTCPDFEGGTRLYALVTQTIRGEVAVVDLSSGSVIDSDKSTPGFSFLPVGEGPTGIASTPGGVASFVGVGGVGREGIFALPSSCLRGKARDLTAWPACSLPAPPGDLRILIDPAAPDGAVRASCDSTPSLEAAAVGAAVAASREECAADLALESLPAGRRKLLVEVPSLGGLAVMDAQELLDRQPGSFDPCLVERWLPLEVLLPPGDITQKVPSDLVAPGCVPEELNYGPAPAGFLPRPSGVEVAGERLYVADLGAPVVHVLDAADPCDIRELPPLLPLSFEAKNRVVTTRRVAVSPPTLSGSRYAYVVDDFEGSVMVFDVSPGASDRTPLVRPGSPLLPFEPADRIALTAPVRDITFAMRDEPIADPDTGIATVGTLCDPRPDASAIGAKYRPTTDFTGGARPRKLRGVFGFVALSSGQLVVIDVEDWDAPCRRPVAANPGATEDFRGCSDDAADVPFFTQDATAEGKRTVSGEMSCRVVEPHRTRSGNFILNAGELGVRGPSLRGFPRLQAPVGGNLATDQSEEGRRAPRLYAVDFDAPGGGSTPAEVFVGTTRYVRGASNPSTALDLEPGSAERLSVALMQRQPRAFADEDVLVEYEGALVGERSTGFLDLGTDATFRDADGAFCSRGVEDGALAREAAQDLGVSTDRLDAYAERHADYVQITSGLRGEKDRYWQQSAPLVCGGQSGKAAFLSCRNLFGTPETPSERRDLRIKEAWQDRLSVEPRVGGQEVLDQIACCFGGSALKYKVRAGAQWIVKGNRSGFRHDVTTDSALRCVRDCNPRRALLRSRALEISSSSCGANQDCAIGRATESDAACVITGDKAVTPGGAGAPCIFQSLMYRFAIYRGNEPSQRDMAFSFQLSGGFAPLLTNLASQTAAVSPQSMRFIPQVGQIAVVDGAASGLVLVSLDTVSISRLFF